MPRGLDLLTHSREQCFKTCRRKEFFAYICGIRPVRPGTALRFGGIFHDGLDVLATHGLDRAFELIILNYKNEPAWVTDDDARRLWQTEQVQVSVLLGGYSWYWGQSDYEMIQSESTFIIPVINPDTNHTTRSYKSAGKKDKIVKLPDGRLALMEHKTTGDSIAPESDYWKRIRLDAQVTRYFDACHRTGIPVQTVIYDVIHKPGMDPYRATPEDKRKYKKDGSLYANMRETDEPLGEYAERLRLDIQKRPEFYFQRQEVPRTDQDVREFRKEQWQLQQDIRKCEREQNHYRNTAACTAPYRCEYLDVCHGAGDFSMGIPEGFEQLDWVHPELKELDPNDHETTTAADRRHSDTATDGARSSYVPVREAGEVHPGVQGE